jgi:hypothetical protein
MWLLIVLVATIIDDWGALQSPTHREPYIGAWALIFLLPAPVIAIAVGQGIYRVAQLVHPPRHSTRVRHQ